MTPDEIKTALTAEIGYAIAKHYPNHVAGDISDRERLIVLESEVREVRHALADNPPPPHDLRSELVDVMSICAQWLHRL